MRCSIRAVLEYCILLDALLPNALHCLEEGETEGTVAMVKKFRKWVQANKT